MSQNVNFFCYFSIKNLVTSDVTDEAEQDSSTCRQEPGKSPKKPRRPVNRFGDMTEEEVLNLKLPEHLGYNLDILFVSVLCMSALQLLKFITKCLKTKMSIKACQTNLQKNSKQF